MAPSSFFWLLSLVSLLVAQSRCKRVDVHTVPELVKALNDTSVDHITLAAPSFNFTDAEMPEESAIISARNLTMEGMDLPDGKQVYIDANKLVRRVRVINGGFFYQRNFWADDCLFPNFPYTCFSEQTGGGSRVELRDMQFSDATCVDVKESTAITAMVNAAKYVSLLRAKITYIDDRTVHAEDSGWIPYVAPSPAYWRIVNVSLTCTGNITHDLPSNFKFVKVGWNRQEKATAASLALVVLSIGYWLYSRIGMSPIEYRIALMKGYTLISELGAGRGGKVYKARHRTSGKLVAIKVISIKPTEWDQLRSVWRECQLMTTINSEGCIKVITYYSARIAHRGIVSKAWSKFNPVASGYEEVELAPEMMQEPDSRKSPVKKSAPKRADPVTSVSGSLVASRSASVASATGSVSAASATFSAYESDVSYPLPDAMSQPEGSEINSMGLQVHMVMPFADCGTLYDAVRANKLRNPDGSAKLSAVIETAIDIARGVAYLHSPNRRLVHRDISPSNILLMSEFNSRGFRAVLSDFGLSTIMALALTHKTSDTKGTVAYMPPECFTDSIVSTSTDIYSMGVLLLFMLTGKEPYRGMTTGQIVHAKMSAGHDQVPILNELERSENTCVHGLVDIIKNCTHFDRKQRMSAAELCRQLEDLALEQASE